MTDTVLGIDVALVNSGYSAWEIDDSARGLSTRVTGGTVSDHDTESPLVDRCAVMVTSLWDTIRSLDPTYLVLEAPLTHGVSKSPTGVAVYTLLVQPLRQPQFAPLLGSLKRLEYVVTLHPARLSSFLRHPGGTRSEQKAHNKERYQLLTNHTERVSEHEVDAFWLAHYGIRFLRTAVQQRWGKAQLSATEQDAFFYSEKQDRRDRTVSVALVDQEGRDWWRYQNHPSPRPHGTENP